MDIGLRAGREGRKPRGRAGQARARIVAITSIDDRPEEVEGILTRCANRSPGIEVGGGPVRRQRGTERPERDQDGRGEGVPPVL
jgi:hypothetical protein